MVTFKQGSKEYCASYNCAIDTGEIEYHELNDAAYRWLDNMSDEVDACIDAGTMAWEAKHGEAA
jgi:hypothetical protein